MPMPDGTPLCAGSVILDQLSVMKELVGDEGYQRALARMHPDERELIETMLPVSWVDPDVCNRFMMNLADERGQHVEPFMLEAVRIGVERTLNGIWRVLLRFTSDNALVSRTPVIYKKTYDSGTLTSHMERRGEAHLLLEGWPNIPRLDLIGLQAGIEATLRCAGRQNASVSFQRTAAGATFTATWDV